MPSSAAAMPASSFLPPMRVRLVDPSLFTAPYDAAVTEGLLACGVHPRWATRPLRRGDLPEIPAPYVDAFFYRRVDDAAWLPRWLRPLAKGVAHAWGLLGLVRRVRRERAAVVHFQWTVLPPIDALAIAWLRRTCTVVVTLHDTVPFNGERLSWLQNAAADLPATLADAVIVHTESGRRNLLGRGFPPARVHLVPHGPLPMRCQPAVRVGPRDARFTYVLFGEIKPYKGIDLLVEALARLDLASRDRIRVVVAGRLRMDLAAIQHAIAQHGLERTIELRIGRLSEQEMADLFDEADGFVFPYRQIDASGVYYLVKGLGKPIVASRVGVFAEDLPLSEVPHRLVDAGDVSALAQALIADLRPATTASAPPDIDSAWIAIARKTCEVYRQAAAQRQGDPTAAAVPAPER